MKTSLLQISINIMQTLCYYDCRKEVNSMSKKNAHAETIMNKLVITLLCVNVAASLINVITSAKLYRSVRKKEADDAER